MILAEWAARHNIPPHMIAELRVALLGADMTPTVPAKPGSEAAAQNEVRLAASREGARLWRNNVGVLKDDRGVPVRFGLCNESPAINAQIKSSDLIGIKPVVIMPEHVGQTFGRFWSVEVKHGGWKFTGTDREKAQLRWIETVQALGGLAYFSTGAATR